MQLRGDVASMGAEASFRSWWSFLGLTKCAPPALCNLNVCREPFHNFAVIFSREPFPKWWVDMHPHLNDPKGFHENSRIWQMGLLQAFTAEIPN